MLCLLTIFGPISMDLYLPVLPALTTELGATTSAAQLTVTACLLGLAIGQVVAGPVSDRFGRRVLAGGVGIVISQAAGRDLYTGGKLVRYYGRLTVIAGLAAVVGPVLGGQLASVTDWRGFFTLLAVIGALILLACVFIFRETLPETNRTTGGLVQTGRDFARLLADRVLLGTVLISGMASLVVGLVMCVAGRGWVARRGESARPSTLRCTTATSPPLPGVASAEIAVTGVRAKVTPTKTRRERVVRPRPGCTERVVRRVQCIGVVRCGPLLVPRPEDR